MSLFEVICTQCGSVNVKMIPRKYVDGSLHIHGECKDCKSSDKISQNLTAEEMRLPFGKYRGSTIKEVCVTDPNYASWLVSSGAVKNSMKDLITQCLKGMP